MHRTVSTAQKPLAASTAERPASPPLRSVAATPSRSTRLFLALWPGPRAREALAAASDAWRWPPGSARVAPERLHLTLHFLGSIEIERVGLVQAGVAVPFRGFELVLDRAGVWPHGIAVLLARSTPPALARLHRDLGAALAALGVPLEARPWQPHVTLARRAPGARPPAALPVLRWRVRGYALVESRLGSNGGYRVLQRYG